ncbi:hypothetical protein ACLOJK_019360, partial [Asimina triloba]
MAATIAADEATPSPPLDPAVPPAVAARSQPPRCCRQPCIVAVARRRRRRRRSRRRPSKTHHCGAVVAPIQAIHHDGNNELIPDLLRSQAEVDHRGHTRRVFLAHHQQIQLHPAPIVSPSGHPFSQKLLPPFLVINKAWISRSRPFIMLATVPIICQHAHERTSSPNELTPSTAWPPPGCPRDARPRRVRSCCPFCPPSPKPPTCRLQHIVNVGSAIDDRRFALKATAKAT